MAALTSKHRCAAKQCVCLISSSSSSCSDNNRVVIVSLPVSSLLLGSYSSTISSTKITFEVVVSDSGSSGALSHSAAR
jgi:hypothetical protein